MKRPWAIEGMFVERKVCYLALFTNLVRWHAGAVSFPLSDIILAQLACPLSDIMFCLHLGITNLSLYKHCTEASNIKPVASVKNITIVNDAPIAVSEECYNLKCHLLPSIKLLESSIRLLVSSIMILENIFTGITHGDHMFIIQATGLSFQL
jgi:hypothetical protein